MTARTRLLVAAAAVAWLLPSPSAVADVFRPAYLELRELDAVRYDVLLKVPAQGADLRLAIDVRFPEGTVEVTPRRGQYLDGAHVSRWRIERAEGLVGTRVEVVGRAAGVTDVLTRLERRDGTSQVASFPPGRAVFTIEPPLGLTRTAVTYLVLGVEHILAGVDHLLFVLSLLLIVRGFKRIVATITAFTVAHSLTLAAATLGFVAVPGRPVEAAIALSIVFVAAEVVRTPRRSMQVATAYAIGTVAMFWVAERVASF